MNNDESQPELMIPPSPSESGFPRERRFIFVQLLFSLTAAEIAREAAELTLQSGRWGELLPAYFHLILATAIVTSSWVGWSVSEASLRLKVKSVFSWPFVVLLLDVALVICYFILVRGAEIPLDKAVLVPSARIECDMMALIFVGYFLWDILTKAVILDENASSFHEIRSRFLGSAMWRRGWISLLCMISGIVVWYFLESVNSKNAVLAADGSLFFFILLFRALKETHWRLGAAMGLFSFACGFFSWYSG